MKNKKVVFIIIAVMIACFVMGAASFADASVYKVILPDTPLYENTDMTSDVLFTIPQNAIVTVIDEPIIVGDISWQKISYTSYVGYVVSESLYKSYKNDDYNVTMAKAKSATMGGDIALYASHSTDSEVLRMIHDGERVRIIDDGIDYGDFYSVEYDNDRYFALKTNVTDGLSYNQIIAVIISASVAGGIIIICIIVMLVRRRRFIKS